MALRVSRQNTEVLAPSSTGKLRITRQNVEVLAPSKTGKLRVTRQNVEVLNAVENIIYERNITDTLTFTQEFTTKREPIHVVDTLNFVQTAEAAGPRTQSIDDPIVFSQVAYLTKIYELDAINTLTLIDSASYSGLNNQSITAPIIFQQFADCGITNVKYSRDSINWLELTDVVAITEINKLRLAQNNLNINQTVGLIGPKYLYASNHINITHNHSVILPYNVSVSSNLLETTEVFNETTFEYDTVDTGLRDNVNLQIIPARLLINHLNIDQSAIITHVKVSATSLTASSTLVITDSVYEGPAENIIDTLIFNQSADCLVGRAAENSLIIEQTIVLEQILGRLPSNTLDIIQSVSYTLLRAGTLCTYSPFVGGNSDPETPAPPDFTGPTLVKQNNIQFTYPVETPTHTLTLRGPEFRNKDRLSFQRINRESRGGTLIVFADPIWPRIQTMVIEFYALTETECQEALTFVSASLGKIIAIRDWEGRIWRGVITTPENPIVRNGKDNNSISLEIEIFGILDWHTFLEEEWRIFAGFDWDYFIGE
jgi:hypothetical protein